MRVHSLHKAASVCAQISCTQQPFCTSCRGCSAVSAGCASGGRQGCEQLRVRSHLCVQCLLLALSSLSFMNEWVREERAGLADSTPLQLYYKEHRSWNTISSSFPALFHRQPRSQLEEDSLASSLSRSWEKGSLLLFALQENHLCINCSQVSVIFYLFILKSKQFFRHCLYNVTTPGKVAEQFFG